VYDTIKLGQKQHELYPVLMNAINQTNNLIDQAKLGDKSVFSQISQILTRAPSMNPGDSQMQKQLNKKELQIRRLQEQMTALRNKKTSKPAAAAAQTKKSDPKAAPQQATSSNKPVQNNAPGKVTPAQPQ